MDDLESKARAALEKYAAERGLPTSGWRTADRVTIPPFSTQMADIDALKGYLEVNRDGKMSLYDWYRLIAGWLMRDWKAQYSKAYPGSSLVQVEVDKFHYLFDEANGRQVGAYKIVTDRDKSFERDHSRMRGFPAHSDKQYQKGHMMAHSMGGGADINLFHQLAIYNNGPFRELENLALKNHGTFYCVRLGYANAEWEDSILNIRTILNSDDRDLKRTFSQGNFFGDVAKAFHPQSPMLVEQLAVPLTKEIVVSARRFANSPYVQTLLDLAKRK